MAWALRMSRTIERKMEALARATKLYIMCLKLYSIFNNKKNQG
jgi:hypothetical protein